MFPWDTLSLPTTLAPGAAKLAFKMSRTEISFLHKHPGIKISEEKLIPTSPGEEWRQVRNGNGRREARSAVRVSVLSSEGSYRAMKDM